ncbi:MAG TPA: helicase C-terminal domain-containing protein [Actinomycetes bacterium]|nr:helicase C-terminal domain-containing protein [Actinomycetes bacterium]
MPASVPELLKAAVAAIGGAERPGQVRMAGAVADAIGTGQHLIVQAGTGTGKSLAYLVPVLAHGDRVVVATATIALQNQLVGRDLPRLVEAVEPLLDRGPRYAILKGRRNYLCLQRLHDGVPDEEQDTLFDPKPTSDLGRQVVRLRDWADATETGDRDELVPGVDDRAWAQVSVTASDCLGAARCPFGEECYAELARERAAEADVVVTNHALLAIDALEPFPVLGEHAVVVIDEGHELVDRVTNAATDELRITMIDRSARRAIRYVKDTLVNGLVAAGARLRLVLDQVPPGRLDVLPGSLVDALAEVRNSVHPVLSALGDSDRDRSDHQAEANRRRARSAAQEVHEVAVRLLEHSEFDVAWCEPSTDRRGAVLRVAPLSVSGLLREALYQERTVILTSATLALGGSFDVIARQVGLPVGESGTAPTPAGGEPAGESAAGESAAGESAAGDSAAGESAAGGNSAGESVAGAPSGEPAGESSAEDGVPELRWRGLDVGSPFDFPSQAILYVARHLPPPGRDGQEPRALDELVELMEAAGGRTLGLFSSYRAAVAAAAVARDRTSLPVLLQGEDSTAQLVARFADDEESCLFGTLSLWQGVDVPGPACQLVVIDRIPFPRPDDPIRSARQKAVDEAGGNGFLTIAAAHAALLLAQGAGRLIRTSADRGVVAVLDPRLATARYAPFLRASLPSFWYTTDPARVRTSLANLRGAAAAAAQVRTSDPA